MQIPSEKTALSSADWRHCSGCGALARHDYYRDRCPGCGGLTAPATVEQLRARGPIVQHLVAIHGRAVRGAR